MPGIRLSARAIVDPVLGSALHRLDAQRTRRPGKILKSKFGQKYPSRRYRRVSAAEFLRKADSALASAKRDFDDRLRP
jgi:hypothetical protein